MAVCRAVLEYHDTVAAIEGRSTSTLLCAPQATHCLPGLQTHGEARLGRWLACMAVLAARPGLSIRSRCFAVVLVCLCTEQPLPAAYQRLRGPPLPMPALVHVPALQRLLLETPLLGHDGLLACRRLPAHLPALAVACWLLPEGGCALLSHKLCCSLLLGVQLLCCGRPAQHHRYRCLLLLSKCLRALRCCHELVDVCTATVLP